MNSAVTANLIGITGIARRLVLDGALEESAAREALDTATRERKPIATYLRELKLVSPAQGVGMTVPAASTPSCSVAAARATGEWRSASSGRSVA